MQGVKIRLLFYPKVECFHEAKSSLLNEVGRRFDWADLSGFGRPDVSLTLGVRIDLGVRGEEARRVLYIVQGVQGFGVYLDGRAAFR